MKKLLTTLGLTSLASITIANVATETISIAQNTRITTKTEPTKKQALPTPLIYHFQEQNIDKIINWSEYIYFAIDNINLTTLGITTIDQLHQYYSIKIPGLKISFSYWSWTDPDLQVNGDSWVAKNRNLGSENWWIKYSGWVGAKRADLYAASTIWYNNNGYLMMRLAYKAELGSFWSENRGRIIINTDSFIEFI